MPYSDYPCPICEGSKIVDIGNEINDEKLAAQVCPACDGRGYIHVEHHIHTFNEKSWKRIVGEL